MQSRQPIVLLPTDYSNPNNPLQFNGNWVAEQATALAERYRVSVVHPILARHSSIELHDVQGVTVCRASYRHIRRTWLLPYALAALRGIRAVGRPRLIHAHDLYPAGLVSLAIGRRLGIPVAVTVHWGQLPDRMGRSTLMALILPFVLRRARVIVAVSGSLADEMRQVEPRCHPVVVENTVLSAFFEQRLADPPGCGETLRVLFVGRLRDDGKGLPVLLQALALSRRTGSFAAHLTVIGDGAVRHGFEQFAQELGLTDACTFLGDCPRDRVVAAMAHCHVLAVPSRYETFGVVYAEAMACGKPVVACAIGPLPDLVPPWAGRLVAAGDAEGVAAALEAVALHARQFDPARIRAYATARFGPVAFAAAMSRVYDPLLEPSSRH